MWKKPFRVQAPVPALLALLALVTFAPLLAPAGAQTPQRPGATPYLTGQLLVASPELQDPNFAKAVVFMVDHGPDGALGVIINREIGKGRIAMLMKGFGMKGADAKGKIMLHFGGPVRPESAFILHSADWHTPLSRRIGGGISFTTDADILRALGQGKGPKHILFALGYAGWVAGQLESEIESGAWTVAPAGAARVFGHAKETLWERIRGASGVPL